MALRTRGCKLAVEGNALIVNGKRIRLTQERDPVNLKWNEVGADVVIEATGLFLDKEGAGKHLTAEAKKVVISAPSKDDTSMFVFGVNHASYAGQAIVSNASCTTNALAPLAKVLHDQWGIKRGLMTTRERRDRHAKNRGWLQQQRLAGWTHWPLPMAPATAHTNSPAHPLATS